jgi:hypothetical protein
MSDTSYDPNSALGDLAITYNGQITPPAPAVGPNSALTDVLNAQAAQMASETPVDAVTALQSKLGAVIPKGAGLPVALMAIGLAAVLLMPSGSSSSGRR